MQKKQARFQARRRRAIVKVFVQRHKFPPPGGQI
jgi:hypothetical protein